MPEVRAAKAEEAPALTLLALRSKASWGYGPHFMEACRAELTVSPELLTEGLSYVLEADDGTVLGFYVLSPLEGERIELELLFLEPSQIGRGLGELLLRHAMRTACAAGAAVMEIQGDPHAAHFYERVGARKVGERSSASIPGRRLPLFELRLPR